MREDGRLDSLPNKWAARGGANVELNATLG